MGLEVIGTGWGRTGTDSMREALNILGLGPCHHMFEINADPALRDDWRALARGAAPDWDRLFRGFRACVDWPSCHYWRELIAFYPKARVILTARPAEEWWDSFAKTLLLGIRQSTDPESLGQSLIAAQALQGRPDDRDHVIGLYRAHVAEVMATVPPDRLLVHNLGDGWEPLCAHLGLPVPDVPYPSRNSAAELRGRFNLKT
jgi:Sulfotransferase domain